MLGYRYTALVVDDEDAVRTLTIRALERRGFDCTEASDGVEAHRLLATRNFQVLVTDLRMPNGNGYSLAIDQLERAERPMTVVLTGVMEPRLAQDLLRRGIDDIMFKPVDYEMFAGKVLGLIERRLEEKTKYNKPLFANGNPEASLPVAARDSNETLDEQVAGTLTTRSSETVIDVAPVPLTMSTEKETTEAAPLRPEPPPGDHTPHYGDAQPNVANLVAARLDTPPSTGNKLTPGVSFLLNRLAGRKLAWFACGSLLLFSVWLWLQVQLLRQTNRAISALEELGARIAIAENGSAFASFAPNERPTGLSSLRHVPNLRRVSVAGTLANDDDLQTISTLVDLEELDLQRTQVSDEGLQHLKDLNKLLQLSLRGTQVTDAGLAHLKKLQSLRTLSLRDTRVTAKGVQELRQAMPSTSIDSIHPVQF